jgi:methionine sulfoxide reductase heme-binding subunit
MPRFSPFLLWALLAAPLALLTYNYVFETAHVSGEVYYGGYVHDTGRYAAWLLLAALAATPLRLTFPGSLAARWFLAQRRYLGVASFAYAAAHLAAYLARQEWDRVLEDLVQAGFWTGWIAFAIFAALAVTSNNLSVRLLRRSWKSLHRLVHPAAVLTFAHWVLTAFDPFLAWCHIAALALLEGYRLARTYGPWRVRAPL